MKNAWPVSEAMAWATFFARRALGGLGLAALLAVAAPAQAEEVQGWVIERTTAGEKCFMTAVFVDDVMFTIFWEPRLEETTLSVSSSNWDSLRGRHGQTTRIDFHLRGNSLEYDEWWDGSALIVTTESGTEGIAARFGREHADDIAVSFALASGVSVEAEGKTIGRYNLAGTRAAFIALRKCGERIMREGRDPFAN